ncbi:hypothetical protein PUN28_014373 [Cardiocondyla obscurior]
MLYYLLRLFLSGSIFVGITITVGVIFVFYLLMYKTLGMSEISKGSSYGAVDTKKDK